MQFQWHLPPIIWSWDRGWMEKPLSGHRKLSPEWLQEIKCPTGSPKDREGVKVKGRKVISETKTESHTEVTQHQNPDFCNNSIRRQFSDLRKKELLRRDPEEPQSPGLMMTLPRINCANYWALVGHHACHCLRHTPPLTPSIPPSLIFRSGEERGHSVT